jgi:hypothetical protein
MAGTGPPPNPGAIRRNPRVGLVTLPAEGYRGRTPKWPLPDNPRLTATIQTIEDEIEVLEDLEADGKISRTQQTKLTRTRMRLAVATAERDAIRDSEKELWRKLWRTPQAAQWATLKWDREVALYVRHQAAAEIGSMEDSREARLRAKALGLTPDGMKSLMWTIATDQVGAQRQQRQAATGTDGAPPRRRLSAVEEN